MEFKIGDAVFYGLHGKCMVTAIETKHLGAEEIPFYEIRAIKNPLTGKPSTSKGTPAILVPVSQAVSAGLRPMMTREQAEQAMVLLAEPDYYFELNEKWHIKQKRLEETLRREGSLGLIKTVGHLFFFLKKSKSLNHEANKFFETVQKNLVREMSEVLDMPSKDVDAAIQKALKKKITAVDS